MKKLLKFVILADVATLAGIFCLFLLTFFSENFLIGFYVILALILSLVGICIELYLTLK